MPYINLIHEQLELRKVSNQKTRLGLVGLVAASVISVGTFGTAFVGNELLKGATSEVKSKVVKIQPSIDELDEAEKALKDLGPRLTTLEAAQVSTEKWSRILDHVAKNAPSSVWLNQVRSQENKTTKEVTVAFMGMSLDQDGVAEFMLRLKNCEHLSKVDLKFTQGEVQQDKTFIKFEVNASVAGTGEQVDEKKPKKGTFSDQRASLKEAS
ncbi:MAG: PilN domain-containing protein [Armatimonadetes bacterium]|nr:PilN domain-containing protein [Armatimonadota bacterium]